MNNTGNRGAGDIKLEATRYPGVETIMHKGELLCIVIPATPAPASTTFYTPPVTPVQVGKIVYEAGSEIAPHKHTYPPRPATTGAEVLYVQSGRLEVDIFAADDSYVCMRELNEGDLIVLVTGGHGFRFAENTVLIEVRPGPFRGVSDRHPL